MAIVTRSDSSSSRNSVSASQDEPVSGRKWRYYSRTPGTLEDLSFTSLDRRQANICLMGEDGTGKTSFATRYAPEPVVVLSFDGRSRQAVKEAREDLGRKVDLIEIAVTHKALPPDEMKLHAREVVERTMYTYETLIEESKKGRVRTILWDTATEYSEILKLAYDGTMEQTKEGAKGTDKDFISRQWWRIFNLAREAESKAHVIVTARTTEIWKNDKPTGAFKPKCNRTVMSAVDFTMMIRMKKDWGGKSTGEFEIEVTNPKTNIDELYEVYDASMWGAVGGPFVYACCMNYKDSVPSDWK